MCLCPCLVEVVRNTDIINNLFCSKCSIKLNGHYLIETSRLPDSEYIMGTYLIFWTTQYVNNILFYPTHFLSW